MGRRGSPLKDWFDRVSLDTQEYLVVAFEIRCLALWACELGGRIAGQWRHRFAQGGSGFLPEELQEESTQLLLDGRPFVIIKYPLTSFVG